MGIVYSDQEQEIKRKFALLIGMELFDNKRIPALAGVRKDMNNFEKILGDPSFSDFNVTKCVNERVLEVRKAISMVCHEADENDVVFFLYSGHGTIDQNKSCFLLCKDSEPDFVDATCLESEFVLSQFRKSRCKNFIIIVDACHSGAFFNNNRGLPEGLVALTACDQNQLAYESIDGGAFSSLIINGLRSDYIDADRDGKITFSELFDYIIRRTVRDHPDAPTPKKWEWNVHEDVCLFDSPRPVFISYQRRQKAFVGRLSRSLQREDIMTFVDQEKIRVGDNWKSLLEKTIQNSRAFLFVMNKDILNSKVSNWELAVAHKHQVPILPILIEEFDVHAMFEERYGHYNRLVFDRNDFNRSVGIIVDHIKAIRIGDPALVDPADVAIGRQYRKP